MKKKINKQTLNDMKTLSNETSEKFKRKIQKFIEDIQ